MSQLALDEAIASQAEEDTKAAGEICKELCGFRLSINKVAGFVTNANCSLVEMVTMFKSLFDVKAIVQNQEGPVDAL